MLDDHIFSDPQLLAGQEQCSMQLKSFKKKRPITLVDGVLTLTL